MKTKNWRVAFLSSFCEKGAQRVLNQRDLSELVTRYRGITSISKLQQIKKELIALNVLFQVTENVFLNMVCTPQSYYAEAASSIRPGSFVSSDTILFSKGVINEMRESVITSVILNHSSRLLENEIVNGNGVKYMFYSLPKEFFPPYLPFDDDVIDRTYLYLSFTAEKALLDYLYIEKYMRSYIPLLPRLNLSRLDLKKFMSLAQKIGLTPLAKECLECQVKINIRHDSASYANCGLRADEHRLD